MKKKLKDKLSIVHCPLSIVHCSLLILLVMTFSCSTKDAAHDHAETYICPMHPTVISDKPGVCPVCGMDLVRKASAGEEVKITEELARLIKSPNEAVVASTKTVRGEFKSMEISMDLNGIVSYDTRNIYTIPSRTGGRIEKVFLRYNFQVVVKGQKVAEVYSPELVNAQRELIYLLQNDAGNSALIDASKNKLSLLGASEKQIESLMKSKEVVSTFSIYSPYSGYVISEGQVPVAPTINASNVASSGGMGMGGAVNSNNSISNDGNTNSSDIFVREGSYVSAGQTLFSLVNATSLWIEFNVPASQALPLKQGNALDLFLEEEKQKLKIDFIEPFTEEGLDFIKIRSYITGSDLLIGQLVQGKISFVSNESLWLPKEAVVDLGIEQIVFVKERGQFKPKKVGVGIRSNGLIEIVTGIASSEEVAVNAQYLMDSESFVKTTN
jgi:membrane fusion protein, copper/silver efflux system